MLDDVIASLEAKKQQRALDSARIIREHDILAELGPRLWSQFRALLKTECDKRPQYFTFRIAQQNDAAVVTCSNRRALEINYLSASNTIAYRVVAKGVDDFISEYTIGLDEKNRAAIFDAEGNILPSSNYVVDELLSLLLQR